MGFPAAATAAAAVLLVTLTSTTAQGDSWRRCLSNTEIDERTFHRITYNLDIEDETSEEQKCLLRCFLEAMGLVRDGVINARRILWNVQHEAEMAGHFSSVFGKNVSLNSELLASDLEACSVPGGSTDCDAFYTQYKCIAGKIFEENLRSYVDFEDADAATSQELRMRRHKLLLGNRHSNQRPGAAWGRPPPPRRGGRPRGDDPRGPPPVDDNGVDEPK